MRARECLSFSFRPLAQRQPQILVGAFQALLNIAQLWNFLFIYVG